MFVCLCVCMYVSINLPEITGEGRDAEDQSD